MAKKRKTALSQKPKKEITFHLVWNPDVDKMENNLYFNGPYSSGEGVVANKALKLRDSLSSKEYITFQVKQTGRILSDKDDIFEVEKEELEAL